MTLCQDLARVAVLVTGMTIAGTASARDVVMAYSGSMQDPSMVCSIQTISTEIAEMIGGTVEMHVGGTGFATPQNLYTQLERGVTDISVMPLAYTPGRFPLSEVFGLPFVASDNTIATVAVNRILPDFLADEFAGTHPLFLMGIPQYQIHLREPVEDVTTGLEGKRIRVTGETLSQTVRALGADIVGLPIFQVYENMQKGVIDGFVLPNVPLASFKLHEVSSYHVQVDFGLPVLYLGLSHKFWDSLTPEQQATVTERYTGPEASERYVDCFNEQNDSALAMALETDGTVSRPLTDAERASIEAIVDPIVQDYLDELDDRGLPGHAFHDALKAEMAKLAAGN